MISYNLPVFMSIGDNEFERIPELLEKHFPNIEKDKILLFTTDNLFNLFRGKVQKLMDTFRQIEVYSVKESSFNFAVEAAKYISLNNFRIAIGLGGGTVLDTAKFASFVAKIPYISVSTTLSNDGIASPVAVLYGKNGRKKSFGSKIPDGVIIDTKIISNAPRRLLQAGIGDTVSNYTALMDWNLDCEFNGSNINDFAYMLSETAFNSLLYNEEKSLESKQFIHMMAQALVMSGIAMEIAGNTRPCSGSEHLFSHAVDEKYNLNIPHGILVALGSVVSCSLQGRDNKILIDYLSDYGISINPLKIGISRDIFVDSWLSAREMRKDRFTILDKIELSRSLFENIYDKLLEV